MNDITLPAADSGASLPYTADELRALAAALNDLAETLPVDAPGEDGLRAMRWSQALGTVSSNLLLMAVEDYIAQTAEPLSAVIEATQQAHEALSRIRKIDKVVEIVSDVALLGTVIWLRKWNLIVPSLRELRSDVRAPA
ncbi:MAG: hypothetical protein ABW220_12015 [Burkholderiaceae bacterium]